MTARYKEFSLMFYTVLMSFADDLQAVSVDEALIEVTNAVRAREEIFNMELGDTHDRDSAKVVAESIRDVIRDATGCEGILLNPWPTYQLTDHSS
jgi:DNA repair protein REV1